MLSLITWEKGIAFHQLEKVRSRDREKRLGPQGIGHEDSFSKHTQNMTFFEDVKKNNEKFGLMGLIFRLHVCHSGELNRGLGRNISRVNSPKNRSRLLNVSSHSCQNDPKSEG